MLAVVRPIRGAAPPPWQPLPEERTTSAKAEHLYRHFGALVYRIGLRYGRGQPAWAEDLVQQVFADVIERADALNRLAKPAGWLYRAATFRALNRLKRERFLDAAPVRWLLGERGHREPCPEAVQMANADLQRVFETVNAMPPKLQACFYMHYVDGFRQEKVARLLGHSRGYISKLIARIDAALEDVR